MSDTSKKFEGIALNDESPEDGGAGRHHSDGYFGATVAEAIASLGAYDDDATVAMVVVEVGTRNVAATWVQGVGWYVTAEYAGAQGEGFVR